MADFKTQNYQIAGSTEVTTTGTINALVHKGYSLVRMNNASAATINGIVAGYPGQILTIVAMNSNVSFTHNSGSAAAGNQLSNFMTTFATPIAGAAFGCVTYQYDTALNGWRLINHNQGSPISIPYSAGNFTADVGTWTVDSGDVTTLTYFFVGNVCFMNIALEGTTYTVGGGSVMMIALPFTPTQSLFNIGRMIANGVSSPGMGRVISGTAAVWCYYDVNAAVWTTSTNNNTIYLQISFRVS